MKQPSYNLYKDFEELYERIKHKDILLDSRKLRFPKNTVFFALRGQGHNGHDFIPELIEKGLDCFVGECRPDLIKLCKNSEVDYFPVENPLRALQKLAAEHRRHHKIQVVGITGSNGKTIVKEWLGQLLDGVLPYHKSPKSYNSQTGVPLSVWGLRDRHKVGIFEAGISRPGEMERTAAVISPTIGVFTNIGSAHDEGFENRRQKIREKLKLFQNVKTLIYCADHKLVHEEIKHSGFSDTQLLAWTSENHPEADIQISFDDNEKKLYFSDPEHDLVFKVNITEKVALENLSHCLTAGLCLGIRPETLGQNIKRLREVPMRLSLKNGRNGLLLIDDTYNNDLAGLAVALEFMSQNPQRSVKTLIISDMVESGLDSDELYRRIGDLSEKHGIGRVVGVGTQISSYSHFFNQKKKNFFPNTEALTAAIAEGNITFLNELILIKGARRFELEKVVLLFDPKVHRTRLEINLDALSHNLNFYRNLIRKDTKIMVMVKAFAYGSGNFEVAHLLQYHLADYLGVAYTDEGVSLRENGIRLPVMVMNAREESFPKLLAYDLEPEVYSPEQLRSLLDFLKLNKSSIQHKLPLNIHLKFDTGMRRLGFEADELNGLIETLQNHDRSVRIQTFFTHLAAADEAQHDGFTRHQITLFKSALQKLREALPYRFYAHALNSAGIVRFPEAEFDMVRLGIGLYGTEPSRTYPEALRHIGTLKTVVSQLKTIEKGESIGYGRAEKAERKIRVATIAIGYADGFNRRFSRGGGSVLIHGKEAPIVGNVCMDMCMCDVTDIPEVRPGDEVIVFGEKLSVSVLAERLGTIPYEVLTSISERVKRVFYAD